MDNEDINMDWIYGKLDNGTIMITKYLGNQSEVIIPSEINGLPVTVIDSHAFVGNRSIKSIKLPYTLREIRYIAFPNTLVESYASVFPGFENVAVYADNLLIDRVTMYIQDTDINNYSTQYDFDDEKLDEAIEVVFSLGGASISALQRSLKIGYGRAARLISEMEYFGIVGPPEGNEPRRLLMNKEQWIKTKNKQ